MPVCPPVPLPRCYLVDCLHTTSSLSHRLTTLTSTTNTTDTNTMRTAIICAFTLAIIVTVIDGVPGRRRDLVKGRGGLNPREVERRKIGGQEERGEGMRTQMRRGRKLERQSIVVKGNDCEFIYLADITSNSGCSNGQKFVLKVHLRTKLFEILTKYVLYLEFLGC